MAEEDREKDTSLFCAFKKLKVATAWGHSELQDLVAEKSLRPNNAEEQEDSPKLKSPNKTFTQRVKPYPKDKLPAGLVELANLEKLSFAKEACTDTGCHCNLKHRKKSHDGALSEEAKNHLDVVHVCSNQSTGPTAACAAPVSPKRVLKDARLKLHNKHKDHKVVLRAARLRLAGGSNKNTAAITKTVENDCKFNTLQSPTLSTERPDATFGNDNEQKHEDFSSVASKSKRSHKIDEENVKKYDFEGAFRTPQALVCPQNDNPKTLFDFSSLRTSLDTSEIAEGSNCISSSPGCKTSPSTSHNCPLHPGKCSIPCSCSHQARLDDWTADELACYFEEFVHIPKKMSMMAEMMYT